LVLFGHAAGLHAAAADAIEEVVVTGDRSVIDVQGGVGSATAIDADTLRLIGATHIYETMVRVPGVWVSRGSEQEHLTAIRSPVFTGTGACGEFLYLQNGVPIRPEGFCNINNLIEVNSEQAESIEVLRGASSALFGGNALHGAINVITPTAAEPFALQVEGGRYDYGHLALSASTKRGAQLWRIDAQATHTDGYRDSAGHDEQKVTLTQLGLVHDWDVHTTLDWTNLKQETAGYILGHNAYKYDYLRRSNPNPDSYRDAWAARLVSEWSRELDNGSALVLTPYVRRSEMQFLQHFLPGEPTERNSQTSAGLQSALVGDAGRLDWRIGSTLEWAEGDLYEHQKYPAEGSAFIVETRPVGVHYDYQVTSLAAAGFYDVRYALTDPLTLVQSLRVEWLGYDYNNHALDGNTRDDGTPCGFGGCLYTRPSDREDHYTNVAGRLGLEWQAAAAATLYGVVSSGFRPPQATELYRLQSGQTTADLNNEEVYAAELGTRGAWQNLDYSLALYAQRSDNVILRDASGYNVSDGKLDSYGVEFDFAWTPLPRQRFSIAGSYARHQYAFDRAIGGGEVIENGNDVDTAPRWLGSAHWLYTPRPSLTSEIEVVYQGRYYLDAGNLTDYDGYTLVNWRGSWQIDRAWRVFARVMNVTDQEYADRADFAFGNYRYFPGTPRQVFVGFELTLGG
jgi:iron complex outermembrane recepter protein